MKLFLRFSPIILLLLIASGCGSESGGHDDHSRRGQEPWVFRSVLDERARMVTLALNSKLYAAYDAQRGALYRIWPEGVVLDGAVYTTKHGPQPTSVGNAYTQNEYADPWRFISGEDTIPVIADYKGHRYQGDRAYLMYEVSVPGGRKIMVEENPEWHPAPNGDPGLERTFTVENLPEGSQLGLMVNFDHLSMNSGYNTEGTFIVTKEEDKIIPGAHLKQVHGMLVLNSEGKTSMTTWFYPEFPEIEEIVSAPVEEEDVPEGLALIQGSDCQTCHNINKKTVGPAYITIAERYDYNVPTIKTLANKVIQGGNGNWGEAMMTAHPQLSSEVASKMVDWILALDEEGEVGDDPLTLSPGISLFDPVSGAASGNGVAIAIYKMDGTPGNLEQIDELLGKNEGMKPSYTGVAPALHAIDEKQFGDYSSNFYMRAEGMIDIPQRKNYVFRLVSDDGSKLYIDGKLVVDHDGLHGATARDGELILSAGKHPFVVEYFQGGGGLGVSLQWIAYGENDFTIVPASAYSHDPNVLQGSDKNSILKIPVNEEEEVQTGALTGVHPSFDLFQARPEQFKPRVGGLDFMSNGDVVVSTWDSTGSVYRLSNVQQEDPSKIEVKRIAWGLAEPLGLRVVDDEVYILQKQELTKLVDSDGDMMTDEYVTVCNDWQVSANFHEFAFGLEYKDGYFYGTLATAINPGGASTKPQIRDRGRAIKISKEDGSMEFIAHGLRTPNGIGIGHDNEIFIADNQGDWLPSSKILHLEEGDWFGSRSVDFEGTAGLREKLPVVWLPQDEIGNSPSEPTYLNVGPYKNQMIHGEVTHGGIKRVFVEEVGGEYQGCVFRFSQGLEAGINRLAWGPDGALYAGGVGSSGNWSHARRKWYGLQRLVYNEKVTFEMLAVRAMPDGVEIEFTEALAEGQGETASDYGIQQWYYKPTEEYGGPKLDLRDLSIRSLEVSDDRKKVRLRLNGMKAGHVVYINLSDEMKSASGQSLWNKEAWYTMNRIPSRSFARR